MNPAEGGTNWVPGLMMLAAGAVAALAFVFGSKKLKVEPPATGSVDDLNARYQSKLAQLKDHRLQKQKLDAAEWAATQKELEQQAAAILRERDGVKHESRKAEGRLEKKAEAVKQDDSIWAKNPTLTGGLIGGAVVGFFMLLGFNLSNSATDRAEGMSATGGVPRGAGPAAGAAGAGGPMMGQPAGEDPRLAALARRVEDAPQDPDAVADLALVLLRKQMFEDAKPLSDRLGLIDPFHVKGRVVRAVMRAVEGDAAGSMDELEHLATYYPEAYDARMFAGFIAADLKDNARAAASLKAYAATAPATEQPPMIRMMIQQLEAGPAAP
jgi:hypothetical protein